MDQNQYILIDLFYRRLSVKIITYSLDVIRYAPLIVSHVFPSNTGNNPSTSLSTLLRVCTLWNFRPVQSISYVNFSKNLEKFSAIILFNQFYFHLNLQAIVCTLARKIYQNLPAVSNDKN